MPCTGGQQRIFALFLNIPGRDSGFEKNRGLRGCFLLPVAEKGVSLKFMFCS